MIEGWILLAIVFAFVAGATFALSLNGEMPPRVLVKERARLAEIRVQAQDIIVSALHLGASDLALLKGFFLGVVFGLLVAAKYFGVFR